MEGDAAYERHCEAKYVMACAYRGEMLLYERALAVECVRVWREMLLYERHWEAKYVMVCAYRGEMLLYERALAVECVRACMEGRCCFEAKP